jgi:hypothetical protein
MAKHVLRLVVLTTSVLPSLIAKPPKSPTNLVLRSTSVMLVTQVSSLTPKVSVKLAQLDVFSVKKPANA